MCCRYHLLGGGDDGGVLEDVSPELLLNVTEEEGGSLLVDTTDVTEGRHGVLLVAVEDWRRMEVLGRGKRERERKKGR